MYTELTSPYIVDVTSPSFSCIPAMTNKLFYLSDELAKECVYTYIISSQHLLSLL